MCEFTKKSIDIYQLYRNMMKVNMAIKLLMSKEQYAALQYCGCEMDLDQLNFEKNSPLCLNNNQNLIYKNQEILDKQQSNNNQITQPIIYNAQLQDLEEGKNKKIVHKNDEAYLNQIAAIDSDLPLQRQVNNSYIQQMSKNKEYQLSLRKNDNHSTNCEMPSLSNSNQTSNHLQQQEEILTNKHIQQLYLKKFIDKINRNQEITQVDLNIYSSLLGSESRFS